MADAPLSVFTTPSASARYAEVAPEPDLAPWVGAFWVMRTGERPVAHRVLPDGCVDLLAGPGRPVYVAGPATRAEVVPVPPGRVSVGVRLRPGAFPALFGLAARDLVDDTVPADEAGLARAAGSRAALHGLGDGAAARAGHEGRADAGAAPILDALAALLRATARDARPPDPSIEAAAHALRRPGARLSAAAKEVAMSERQLRRRFADAVGLGPKRFARVARMQALLAHATTRRVEPGDWAWLAAVHGFADEAHMVNDVTGLAGTSPARLLGALRPDVSGFSKTA